VATVYDLAGETLAVWKGGSCWITTDGGQNPSAAALALATTTWTPSSYAGSGPLRNGAYVYSLSGKQISVQDADNRNDVINGGSESLWRRFRDWAGW